MYNATTMDFAARYHQDELLREARNARLAHQAADGHHHSAAHVARRVFAVAVAILLLVGAVALI
jgi:hypothetical protein